MLRGATATAAATDVCRRSCGSPAELGVISYCRWLVFRISHRIGTRRAFVGSRMPTAARSKRLTSLASVGHRIVSKSCLIVSSVGLKLTATCRRGLATAARHGKFARFTPPGRVVGSARRTPPLKSVATSTETVVRRLGHCSLYTGGPGWHPRRANRVLFLLAWAAVQISWQPSSMAKFHGRSSSICRKSLFSRRRHVTPSKGTAIFWGRGSGTDG